jgi:hypothetical protein
MSEKNDLDLKRTEELFAFLQGNVPDGYKIPRKERPRLTPYQAWTVIWYLGNQYWQVTDRVERCEVCGDLFHTHQGGTCLDYGKAPYNFCEGCMSGDEYARKSQSRLNPENKKGEA